jgi:8-oxo-dGTP pyrophosphatase MutT (NUDIX family)
VNDASPSEAPRIGAVLVLAYPHHGEPHIVFTERSATLSSHAGQISLPGGSRDPEDASLEVTSLRETEEELGIPARDVRVFGRLRDVYVRASHFLIAPYVGALRYEPVFAPSPNEVAQIIEVPLARLRDPAILLEDEWEVRGGLERVQYYAHGPHRIWGATARVIAQFLTSEYPEMLAAYLRLALDPEHSRQTALSPKATAGES